MKTIYKIPPGTKMWIVDQDNADYNSAQRTIRVHVDWDEIISEVEVIYDESDVVDVKWSTKIFKFAHNDDKFYIGVLPHNVYAEYIEEEETK